MLFRSLPPVRGYRCAYVARQVAVKAAYGLWVTPAEHDAIAEVLEDCPGEPVPTAGTPPPLTPPLTPPVTPPAAPTADVPAGTPDGTQPYANCAAARAAGAAPLHRGDAGWSDSMDGDGDGIACE